MIDNNKTLGNLFFYWDYGVVPDLYKKNIEYSQICNPDRNIVISGPEMAMDVLVDNLPILASIFPKIIIPAVKSDIMRLALLYKFGGWYQDCDTRPRVSLKYWEDDGKDLYLNWVLGNGKLQIQNSLMGGKKGHPFFIESLKIIEGIISSRLSHYGVYKASGPEGLLQGASRFAKDNTTCFQQMDYSLIDVVGDNTKGSWTFQENCGIWADEINPIKFNHNTSPDRIGSPAAFLFYSSNFKKFPETASDNFSKIFKIAGSKYSVEKQVNEQVVSDFVQYCAHDKIAFNSIMSGLRLSGSKELISIMEKSQ